MNSELVIQGLGGQASLREILERSIDNLLEVSPSDASASAEFRESKGGVEGILNIVSSQGRFMAQAVSANVNEVVRSLSHEIQTQLREWRVCRFRD